MLSSLFFSLTIISTLYVPNLVQARLAEFEQCGGKDYNGTNLCESGHQCFNKSVYYSQCLKSCPRCGWMCSKAENNCTYALKNEQCGGKDWEGPKNCVASSCYAKNEWYSECAQNCPDKSWSCFYCLNCTNGVCDSLKNQCSCYSGWYGANCDKSKVLLVTFIAVPIVVCIMIFEIGAALFVNMPCYKSSKSKSKEIEKSVNTYTYDPQLSSHETMTRVEMQERQYLEPITTKNDAIDASNHTYDYE